MDEKTEIIIKGGLSLLALAAVVWRNRPKSPLPEKRAGAILGALAVASVMAYFNFGLFHGTAGIHHWELFHYTLGSKYAPELGYDGIYLASISAQMESSPKSVVQETIRDLRSNQVVRTYTLGEQREAVKARFTTERWRSFVRDNAFFVDHNTFAYLYRIRLDHGYNPTPAWTFVARLFTSWPQLNGTSLGLLALIDPLLLVFMFIVVFRTYGSRVGCIALIIFGLGYPWRFYWVGGAFLRQDWLVAVVLAVCALKVRRHATAGGLLAYATMVRIFPALFLFGMGVVAVRNLITRESLRWVRQFAVGFVLVAALMVIGGTITGRGAAVWSEFYGNLQKHRHTWLTNNVGLANTILYGPTTYSRELVNWSLPEPWIAWQAHMDRIVVERRIFTGVAAALLLLFAGFAVWRSPPEDAAVLGPVAIFSLTLLTCYYWAMLIVLSLRNSRVGVPLWLGVNVTLYCVHLFAQPNFEIIFGYFSFALLGLFVVWLGRDVLGTIRRPKPLQSC